MWVLQLILAMVIWIHYFYYARINGNLGLLVVVIENQISVFKTLKNSKTGINADFDRVASSMSADEQNTLLSDLIQVSERGLNDAKENVRSSKFTLLGIKMNMALWVLFFIAGLATVPTLFIYKRPAF